VVARGRKGSNPVAEFIDPLLEDKVDFGIGLSYRPASGPVGQNIRISVSLFYMATWVEDGQIKSVCFEL
jgi:hypothetical protein